MTSAVVAFGLASVTAPAASADALADSGCNFNVCVYVEGNAGGYTIQGQYRGNAPGGYPGFGHINLSGPGVGAGTDDKQWNHLDMSAVYRGTGAGTACAEFWRKSGSGYVSSGKACVSVE